MSSDDKYSKFYNQTKLAVYPSEFLIRALLGHYPNHSVDKKSLSGGNALDLGCGDGRNFKLLADLGLNLYGLEITQEICDTIQSRMKDAGLNVSVLCGRNDCIPFENQFFDLIVASSSCYYMNEGDKFEKHVSEIARVMKPGGTFICTLPMPTTFIMKNATDLGEGHMRIKEDPYGVRVGSILKKFDSETEIEAYLGKEFDNIAIGKQQDDWWGEAVHLWVVSCKKRV